MTERKNAARAPGAAARAGAVRGAEARSPGASRSESGTPPRAGDESLDDLWPPFELGAARLRGRAGQGARGGSAGGRGGSRGRGRQAQRDRLRSKLTREQIVDAAIAVADAEGSEAISMRRIAQVLRSGTMSLYWHVANKQQLLDLMQDVVFAEAAMPEPSGDWRADLRGYALASRAMLHRHRWVMDFIGGRPSLGPNTILGLERSLATLGGLGLDTATAISVLSAVQTYVIGAVLREMREIRTQRAEERARLDPAEFAGQLAEWRRRLERDGRFPHFLRMLDEGVDPDAPETRDARFEFGLDCVLDGISARTAAERRALPVR